MALTDHDSTDGVAEAQGVGDELGVRVIAGIELSTDLPGVSIHVLGLFLNLEPRAIGAVALTLLAGTPALTCIGLIGAALSVALRRGGLLLPVLVLPLTVPVLIFGVAASNAAVTGVSFGAPFMILCALTLASLVLGPIAAAAALRNCE